MDNPSLDGCWAKHRRAKRHLETLEDLLTAFRDSEPYRITHEFDVEQRALIITAKVLQKADTLTWGVMLGDVVHNLRSALDLLIWQLALLSGSKPGNHLQFPIESNGAGYWSRRKDGEPSTRELRLKGVDEQLRTVVDEAQPYLARHNADAHSLGLLAYLSNVDKHRFIHTALSVIDPHAPDPLQLLSNADAGNVEDTVSSPFPLDGEAEVGRLVFSCPGSNPHVEMKSPLPLVITFSERGIRSKDIGLIWEEVGHILDAYQGAFPATAS